MTQVIEMLKDYYLEDLPVRTLLKRYQISQKSFYQAFENYPVIAERIVVERKRRIKYLGYDPKGLSRFLSYFETGRLEDCWEWQGPVNKVGRARISILGKTKNASRVSYMIFRKCKPPENLYVLHSCHNMKCVNPHHLRTGTALENVRDRMESGRGSQGMKCPLTKFSDEEVLAVVKFTEENPSISYRKIGKKFGMSGSNVISLTQKQSRKYLWK